jgi:hypothetical protein
MEAVIMDERREENEEIEKIQDKPPKINSETVITYQEKMKKLRAKRFGVDGKISEL